MGSVLQCRQKIRLWDLKVKQEVLPAVILVAIYKQDLVFLFSCKLRRINDLEKIILKDFSHCIFCNIMGEHTFANALELTVFL